MHTDTDVAGAVLRWEGSCDAERVAERPSGPSATNMQTETPPKTVIACNRLNGCLFWPDKMKTMNIVIAVVVLLGMALSGFAADASGKKGKLRHVVAFKFKETATPEQIKEVEQAFRALKGKIHEVGSLEWGTNVSKENRDKGFTHCFIVTFKNEKDRDAYLVHPEHKKFVDLALPVIADVFVLDFLAKD